MQSLGLEVLFKGKNFARLLGGLWTALQISLISIAISMVLGTMLGILVGRKNGIGRILMRCYLEFIHIMPQMVLLFIVFFGTAKAFGWNLSGELSSIIVFSLWGTAEMSDLVRGAVTSVPAIQYESAMALGLSQPQVFRFVILPQALRRLIPQSINLITRMIKTTSLVLMIGVVEILKVGQQIIEANRKSSPNAAFGVYLTIFLLYFLLCWPISLAAKRLEKRWG
jgi:polar amino acid transport system permease protein